MDTKTKIKEAAYALFEKQPFDEITTSQIIKEAQVSRRTFYNYFPDKYELMYNYYEDLIVIRVFGHLGMPISLSRENWEDYNTIFFDLLKERHSFYKNMTASNEDTSDFIKFIYGYAINFYQNLRKRYKHTESLSTLEEVTIRSFCSAFISIVKDFMDPKKQLSSQQATTILKRIIPAEYRQY